MLKTCIKHPLLLLGLVSLLISGCATFSGTPQPEVPAKIKEAYSKALKSMKAGKNRTAIKQFKRIAKLQPQLAGPHTNLGMLYLKTDELEQAQQSLEKATELNPANTIAFNYLGIVYRNQGRFDDAEKAYMKALEINNQYDYAHLNLGILYDLYKSDSQKALTHYQQYLKLTDQPDKMVEKWIVDLQRRNTARHQTKEVQG